MNAEFFDAIEELEKEKGIPREYMYEKIRQAMLAAYHTAGFCLDKGSRRRSIFFSLAAIYFCLVCLADGKEGLLFHCAVIFWMAGALPRLKKPRLRRRPGGQIVPAEAPPSELS